MPTALTLAEHLGTLERSGQRLIDAARSAGLEAPVPTCPDWSVRQLVAHQAMVHRWAALHVTGGDEATMVTDQVILDTVDDLPAFYDEGLRLLIDAIRTAPADLEAMTFLNDAPNPREFWARRQAHETTIHMVDALAAQARGLPAAAKVDLPASFAADGIDELLCGFFTRGESKLYDGTNYDVLVAPEDDDRRWCVHVGPKLSVDVLQKEPDASFTIGGQATAIYLTLWNRGDEAKASGDEDFLDRWRTACRVRWS